jgi:hypothetical protein
MPDLAVRHCFFVAGDSTSTLDVLFDIYETPL